MLHAVEGWGKTTIGAYAPNSHIIMAESETGYSTLFEYGRVPERPVACVSHWNELLGVIREFSSDSPAVLVLDALGSFEQMCHQYVCDHEFKGEWGNEGFMSYHKGFVLAVNEWKILLSSLEKIRDAGHIVLLLAHSRIAPYKNPLGADYDVFIALCHEKTWEATKNWADAVLFGKFFEQIESDTKKKAKAAGADQRILFTRHSPAYSAKNRLGMPERIDIPGKPEESWDALAIHLQKKGTQ